MNPAEAVRAFELSGARQEIGHHWATVHLTDEGIARSRTRSSGSGNQAGQIRGLFARSGMGKGKRVNRSRAEVLARESADWFHRGLISAETSKRLAERYDRNSAFLAVLGRWLGIFAIIFLGGSVLLLMGISWATPFFSAIILLLAAGAGFAVALP